MSTVALIICAGENRRWANHTGVPKHLAVLNGERLVDRTARLLHERGVTDIQVITKQYDERYNNPHSKQTPVKAIENFTDVDKFLSSKHLWNKEGRTLIVYGDVYFTEEAMDTIVNYEGEDWRLFCRPFASKVTGTPWGECFAQSFYPEQHKESEDALYKTIELVEKKRIKKGGGWGHYRTMCGVTRGFPRDRMVVIDDETDDIDFKDDYVRLKKILG